MAAKLQDRNQYFKVSTIVKSIRKDIKFLDAKRSKLGFQAYKLWKQLTVGTSELEF